MIAVLSSMGMPLFNGFIGEFTILRGVFEVSLGWAFAVVIGIALGAAYLLWLYQRTMLGDVDERNASLKDLSRRELAVFLPLVVLVFWIGMYPAPFFHILERPSAQIVERVVPGYHASRGIPNPLEPGYAGPAQASRTASSASARAGNQ
jgi:NADH-quinone oxidoreductase subunit M